MDEISFKIVWFVKWKQMHFSPVPAFLSVRVQNVSSEYAVWHIYFELKILEQ